MLCTVFVAMDSFKTLKALDSAKGLKFIHLNVRSLTRKMDQIRLMLSDLNLDIITFSETWLKSYMNSSVVELNGYKLFRLDRGEKKIGGGGLSTYVHDNYVSSAEPVDSMNNEHIKAQWIYIHRPSCKNVYVSNMYRLPNGDLKKAIMYLDECLMSVNVGKTNVFLLGDMNVNYKNKKSPNLKKTARNTDKPTLSLILLLLTQNLSVRLER